jgi:hypothetical protein
MHGQVTRAILTGFLGGLLLAGCGSNGKGQADAPWMPPTQSDVAISTQPEVGTSTQPDAGSQPQENSDAGCDEDALGEDYCIKNWPSNVGGGTIVTRLPNRICKL